MRAAASAGPPCRIRRHHCSHPVRRPGGIRPAISHCAQKQRSWAARASVLLRRARNPFQSQNRHERRADLTFAPLPRRGSWIMCADGRRRSQGPRHAARRRRDLQPARATGRTTAARSAAARTEANGVRHRGREEQAAPEPPARGEPARPARGEPAAPGRRPRGKASRAAAASRRPPRRKTAPALSARAHRRDGRRQDALAEPPAASRRHRAPGGPPSGAEVVGTVIRAAGELAEIGLNLARRPSRTRLKRLPRP